MGTKHILPGLIMATMFMASCYRKQDVITPEANPVGGKGGKAQLRVIAKYYDKTLDTTKVFIKYDALKQTSDQMSKWTFDDSMDVKAVNGSFQAVFDSLKRGNYFIYARGYNFDISRAVQGYGSVQVTDTFKRQIDFFVNMGIKD